MAIIFHTTVMHYETLFQAICRAGVDANRNGFTGYSVDCEKCGCPIKDHEQPRDCETFQQNNQFLKNKIKDEVLNVANKS